jgi:acetolactate synthase-1/2/3 large subunit
LVNCLQNEGVEHIFGYPGGAVLHIYDALDACDDIAHILVRHEQGAVHGADGYARVSGKCGVALVVFYQKIMLNTRTSNTNSIYLLECIIAYHCRGHLTRNNHHRNRIHMDITKDTTITEIEFDGYPKSINMRSYQPEIKVDAGQIDRAVALITQAKKPIIYSGGGSVIGNAAIIQSESCIAMLAS